MIVNLICEAMAFSNKSYLGSIYAEDKSGQKVMAVLLGKRSYNICAEGHMKEEEEMLG